MEKQSLHISQTNSSVENEALQEDDIELPEESESVQSNEANGKY